MRRTERVGSATMSFEQDRRKNGESNGASHEEFLELCALAASGNLQEAEARRLSEHLASCSDCRQALAEFESIATEMIPELGEGPREESQLDPAFSLERAEAAF